MRVHGRKKQLPAFFKFQVGWTMKNMKSAQAILSNVTANRKKKTENNGRLRKLTELNGLTQQI